MKYTIDRSVLRSATIYAENGGVTSIYNDGDSFVTEYYSRTMKDMSADQWEYINDGRVYRKRWPHKSNIDDEMIDDSLRRLATMNMEFTEVPQHNFNFNHK